MSELANQPVEALVETPVFPVHNHLGKLSLTHLNTRVRRFADTRDNFVEIDNEGNPPLGFFVGERLEEDLLEADYPWLYQPTVELGAGDAEEFVVSPSIEMTNQQGEMELTWFNTTVKTFGDSEYNHVEYIDQKGKVKGFFAAQWLLKQLFINDFPWEYQPHIELDTSTKQWYANMTGPSDGEN
jgi:hypothetical protein